MPMKVKKPSKSKLIKKCDILFSLIVRQLGYCEWCGRSDIQLNGHHVIGRAIMFLRYDRRNGCCLCVNCHEFSKTSVKNNPIKFLDWFKAVRPQDYEYIKSKSELIAHYSVEDLTDILKSLKEVYSEMQKP